MKRKLAMAMLRVQSWRVVSPSVCTTLTLIERLWWTSCELFTQAYALHGNPKAASDENRYICFRVAIASGFSIYSINTAFNVRGETALHLSYSMREIQNDVHWSCNAFAPGTVLMETMGFSASSEVPSWSLVELLAGFLRESHELFLSFGNRISSNVIHLDPNLSPVAQFRKP